jgi:tRNA(Ile)-lysidine synthase
MNDVARAFQPRDPHAVRDPKRGALQMDALDVDALRAAPLALRRLIVWRAMNEAAAGRPVGFDHVRAALRLVDSPRTSAAVDAPGHRVQRIGDCLVLTTEEAKGAARRRSGSTAANLFHYPLSIPGEVWLAEAGCAVSAEAAPAGLPLDECTSAADREVAIVRSDVCRGPLAVRNRRPGDRFRPRGLRGRKKLQDFFVDRKVARHHRDAVPLVVDDRDRIVWVAGYAIDDQFRVTDPTQAVLILRLKPVGGCD